MSCRRAEARTFGTTIEDTRLICDKRIRKPAAALAVASILALTIAVPVSGTRQESQATVIRAGVLIDGTGSAPRKNVVLVIKGGRIVETRSATQADAANPGAIDLTGFHVLPGLIDVHAHLTISHDPALDYGELSAAASGILGVMHAERTLMAGFTTVRDPFGPYYADVALRDAIAAGWVDGPRMFVSGPGLTMTGGHGAVGNWAPPELELKTTAVSVADGMDEIRRAVRLHQKYGVDFIKIIATGGIFTDRSDPGAASYTREEIEAAVDEARKRGQRVAAHAHGLEGIRNAVLAGVHSIEHGSYLDAATATLMAERGVFLVSDVYADEYSLTHGKALGLDPAHLVKARAVSDRFRESFKLARAAGVKIAFGSDAGVFPHGENARQLASYVRLGMSPIEALQSATRDAADLIGVSKDVSTIEPGKRADLIAVASDPLKDIRQLEAVLFVMKAGVVVKNETRR
jgi:imidazolonepropionase-like amidohydrolase